MVCCITDTSILTHITFFAAQTSKADRGDVDRESDEDLKAENTRLRMEIATVGQTTSHHENTPI